MSLPHLTGLIAGLLTCALVHAQYVPGSSTVLEIDTVHVLQDGQFTQTMESMVRIETPQGVASRGERKLHYNAKLESLEILQAYTLQKDGTRIDVAADRIRTQDASDSSGAASLSDDKVKVVIFPKVEVGSQLYILARSVQHTPIFPGHFFWSAHFSPHFRHAGYTLNLTHEAGISVRVAVDRMAGGHVAPLPHDAPGVQRYQFTYQQSLAHPFEPGRVQLSDFAPHISLSSFKDYADFAQAYEARAKPMAAVTPAIANLARELVAGAANDRDKVRRLYNWVSRNIRYVAVYVGAGGWVPHAAQSVLDNRYGDCKDHVVLLEALLTAVGIDSSTALINTQDGYRLPRLPINSYFDHVITYVPSLDMYLDSTSQFAPFGTLPDGDMGKPVLLTATGQIGKTPAHHPLRDFTQTDVSLALRADGSVSGRSTMQMEGYLQVSARGAQFEASNREQASIVNRMLDRYQESGTGEVQASAPLDLDSPWQVTSVFLLDPVVNLPAPSAMTIPAGVTPGRIRAIAHYKPPLVRRFPAACSSNKHTESISLQFPANVQVERIPANVNFRLGALTYTASYALQGSTLKVHREFVSQRASPSCNAQDDQHWLALRDAVRQDLRAQIFLK
jgi:transglutaminase-like putative cysteine protease